MPGLDTHTDNGANPASARERIAHELDNELLKARDRLLRLESEIADVKQDVKTFEQAAMRLRGEPLIKHTPRANRAAPSTRSTGVGPAVVAQIADAIREYAQDHDEFRQIDIRSNGAMAGATSSKTSQAFELLRQDGLIRLARRDGNNKWYRLTEAARRGA